MTCALREDIAPTLERLARQGRWSTIVAGLPVGTEAAQLAHLVAREPRRARHLRLGAVIATLGAERVVDDLVGDGLLRDDDRHVNPADDRGTGEVACAQVEFADVVVLDGTTLAAHRHQHSVTSSW